jgi:hypothetical protein
MNEYLHSGHPGKHLLPVAPFFEQQACWPQEGEHILAQHDEASVIVYQAYRPSIGAYALQNGHFGGPDFSFERMSWIKPNFLWMMYRSGWGTKPGQEVVLALRLRRAFFDELLNVAVASSFDPTCHPTREAWQRAVTASDVRLQWDPDHLPCGAKTQRRAIQLGLRGPMLRRMARDELLELIDMTPFVAEQRGHATDTSRELLTPLEQVYVTARQPT